MNGTVSRTATVHTGKDGRVYTGFAVKTTIPAKAGNNKVVEVFVSKSGTETNPFLAGKRIEMQGTLTFRKRGDALYLNFQADTIDFQPAGNEDFIVGTIEFRGKVGKQVEEKTSRKGEKYYLFSAFSTEKDGENFVFTWVRFIRFATNKDTFLVPKSSIRAKGKLELSTYLNKINIGCNVEEIGEWVKAANHNNSIH